MLREAGWAIRVTGLMVVGLITFLTPSTARGGATTQAVCFALLCVASAVWALAEFWRRVPGSFQLAALGVMTAAGSLGATAGAGGISMIAYAAVAMMFAAEALSVQEWLTVGLLGVLAAEIGGIVFDSGVGALLGFPLLLAVGVLLGRNRVSLRVQAEQARQLLAQHEQLRAEQRRADVLEERTRIAREIHDVLAHSLGALGIQLQTVKALFTVHNDPERALEALAAAQRMASGGLTETRRAVQALRTDMLPLDSELAAATSEFAEQHHAKVRYQSSGTPLPLSPEVTVALLRIAQESLVNAAKHAPGAETSVDLEYRSDGVRLTVSNPLRPGAPQPLHTLDAGLGLTGMRERLLLLRGSLDAGQRDGRWVVAAAIPLTEETDR
jgi:signal transduction histidine kinase